ncbi:MAG: outer membrane beta-barrel family protein [Bacteroidaceae bacterium]|nr:outer membrane beta-barrel family protein [Bacteroidaceae bacterium]
MKKNQRTIISLIAFVCTLNVFSQNVIFGQVQDAFLKAPLPEAKVSLLLAADSTVVIDSIPVRRDNAEFVFEPEKKTCKYLIRATLDGYEDGYQPLEIDGNKGGGWMLDDPIELRKIRQINLDEFVVKATKVKMYWKGDTLVYDASAFKLPDGSMLDDLIQQMPGVTMNDAGEIFVNGRKVEELLLGSRSFMRGNKQVLLKNLPYYTVKDIKVYEKQSDMSEALGRDVDARRYVMDVNLKPEYQTGYIANVEAAVGTENRWLGRGFLLGFSGCWRYSLLGNINNVNETRHISGDNHWTPTTMPKSLLTTRSVATNLNYQAKKTKLTDDFYAEFKSFSTESNMRQRHEQFLESSRPTSHTENYSKSDSWNLNLSNKVQLLRPSYIDIVTNFNYEKRDASSLSQFGQWDDGLTASMRTDALSEGRSWNFYQQAIGAFSKKQWYTNVMFFFTHNDGQSWLSSRYNTWQAATQTDDVRHNAADVSNKSTDLSLSNLWRFSGLPHRIEFVVSDGVHYFDGRTHDYLYHPDTLLLASQLDLLNAITDPSNSYDSKQRKLGNTVGLQLQQPRDGKYATYVRWEIGLDVPILHHSLDYQRGAIDTLMHHTWVYFTPHAAYRYQSPDDKHRFDIGVSTKRSPVDMINQIAYRDDSQPLVVKAGNPALKGTSMTSVNANYTKKYGVQASQWHIGTAFNYHHRDVAQSVTYNPLTGVYAYKPMNVSGAYSLTTKFDISSHIDRQRYWTWQMNADAHYNHSIDHAMLAGETESHVNAVNTLTLHDGVYIQYNRNQLNVRTTGDIRWRHSEGKMYDFETLNATDFRYGLSAQYTLPRIKMTMSADGNMYSRRGYGSSSLNTDDFVLNASLSQPFIKGKLIARIEVFDLLHQLSNTQYEVNAQGRTETWYRSLPHYIMAHVVYHWNKNPKKK